MRTAERVAKVLLVLALWVLFLGFFAFGLAVLRYCGLGQAPTFKQEQLQAVGVTVVPGVSPDILLTCVVPEEESTEEPAEVVDPLPDIPVLDRVEAWTPAEEDVHAIARTLWGECRGVESRAERAAVAWCILNRLDAGYADTVKGVCAASGQFEGYDAGHPLDEDLVELARDVLIRHHREAEGETKVGRTLPRDYVYFTGRDGRNWFRKEFRSSAYWDWSLPDPYKEG